MLEGFGLYPVCLQIDLDSYEGDWRHVARFRDRTGWLLVAEAEIWVGTEHQATLPLIVGCDQWDQPIPSFIAANLLRCACSSPQLCDEYPPAPLELLIERERSEVRKRWLRESNAAIARIYDAGDRALRELEGGVEAQLRASDRLISDLNRRRRMLPPDHPGRAAFAQAITEQEDWQLGMVDWLADRRQELRDHFDAQERLASRGLRPRLEVEVLYVVNWHHTSAPSDEALEAYADATLSTRSCLPMPNGRLEFSDGQLAKLASISGSQPPAAPAITPSASQVTMGQPPGPRHRLVVNWQAMRDSLGIAAMEPIDAETDCPAADDAPLVDERKFEPSQLALQEIGEDLMAERNALLARQSALEVKERKFFKGSRKYIANRQEQDRVALQLASLEKRIGNAAITTPFSDPQLTIVKIKQDLERELLESLGEAVETPPPVPQADRKELVARVLNLEALLAQHSPWTDPWFEVSELLRQARRALDGAGDA